MMREASREGEIQVVAVANRMVHKKPHRSPELSVCIGLTEDEPPKKKQKISEESVHSKVIKTSNQPDVIPLIDLEEDFFEE